MFQAYFASFYRFTLLSEHILHLFTGLHFFQTYFAFFTGLRFFLAYLASH